MVLHHAVSVLAGIWSWHTACSVLDTLMVSTGNFASCKAYYKYADCLLSSSMVPYAFRWVVDAKVAPISGTGQLRREAGDVGHGDKKPPLPPESAMALRGYADELLGQSSKAQQPSSTSQAASGSPIKREPKVCPALYSCARCHVDTLFTAAKRAQTAR